MKAIRLHEIGGSDSLHYEDAPRPTPSDDQVLIQVHATAITPTEFAWFPTFHTADGSARPFPIILGHEFSGVVDAVGPACEDVRVGDLVYGLNDWFADGAQAEYCLTVPSNIAPKPKTLDHNQAAVVPISALTAWQGLFDRVHLSEKQRVLIHGAAGGVGSFAVQLARHRNAHVIATTSAGNIELVKSLGADEVIDYRERPFETAVRDVDVVFDTVGGETRDRSWGVLNKTGQMVTIATDAERFTDPRVRDAFFIVQPNRIQLIEIGRLINDGVMRPIVGHVFSMKQFRQAYEQKPLHGKHVLRVPES
jgi:NADPH:quinone reductase-like Zn-dependent oxidoreductase